MNIIHAVGRRKTCSSRVYIRKGKGNVVINKKKMQEYFPSEVLQTIIMQPLVTVELEKKFDIIINVKGGGFTGQAEATRLAIARAIVKHSEDLKPALKSKGYLTRDSRVVERKKYGRKKARKSFQFSKR